MSLSDREKFIQHYTTLSTIRIITNKLRKKKLSDKQDAYGLNKDLEAIRKTRCHRLSDDDIAKLLDDLVEEAMLGGYVLSNLMEDI